MRTHAIQTTQGTPEQGVGAQNLRRVDSAQRALVDHVAGRIVVHPEVLPPYEAIRRPNATIERGGIFTIPYGIVHITCGVGERRLVRTGAVVANPRVERTRGK